MRPASPQVPPAPTAGRWRVIAWALWDCGSTGMNAVVVTFVFSVYLTGAVGSDLPGDTTPTSWLGRAMTAAGLLVAVLAPVTGVWVEAPRRRRAVLTLLTGATVLLTSAMSLIRDDHRYLWAGLILMAVTAACSDLASVPYNAMLRQLSTPQNSGRISGFGWAMGYSGTVLLLLIVYLALISGDGDTRGLLGVPAADGQNVRAAMLLSAAWFLLFALPLLLTAPTPADDDPADRPAGILSAYRKLWTDIKGEWQRDRNIVYYLLASAIFRDGLAGVFAFGAVLGVSVYGISASDVLLFGVSACVVAAIGAVAGGLLDDRIGSKRVIVGSLIALIAIGLVMLSLSGPAAFWACGLLLCLFIGPTQSAARTLMLQMAAEGKEGVAFGLYTTTGRAVSFLAPWLFFTFIDVFGTDRAGMGGLCVVMTAGLLAMLAVRVPQREKPASAGADTVGQP
ncbi:MFS transporter [Mycolicibacterium sp. F2034L]|uniref:MFS transporter n=1 Tax=Mycolicibacterium sp. F2034L TaxID=2926422 RepID=UPI001FF5C947|nr:MFS transporter [Mycolicibacterium sp. F2034L]MCK0176648.1 MFS transporter [Mycolicibacterium sp. F2034L]